MSEDKKDFNELVHMAMVNRALSAMRPVVEKKLLHYEIFQALDIKGLLKNLVFHGGTSLRLCRGSERFSEDLDFAGGADFSVESMLSIKDCLEKCIGERFGLLVVMNNEPARAFDDEGRHVRADKRWISIETSPENPAMPRQKIIDEIIADKVLAFPTLLLDNQGQPVGTRLDQDPAPRHLGPAWMAARGAKPVPELVIPRSAISAWWTTRFAGPGDRADPQVVKVANSRRR